MSAESDKAKLRRSWYERGAHAVMRWRAGGEFGYVCPICLESFPPERSNGDHLTIEHVPSQSMGGAALCLTCKTCNNTAGDTLDTAADIVDRIHAFRHGRPFAPFRVVVDLDGLAVHGELIDLSPGGGFRPLPAKDNPPDAIGKLQRRITEGESGDEPPTVLPFHTWRKVSEHASNVSRLRSAYLVAFAACGYRYILARQLDPVRRHIRFGREPELRVFTSRSSDADPSKRELWVIDEPERFRSLAVIIGGWRTFLPWFGGAPDLYQRLEREPVVPGKGFLPGLVGRPIPWPVEPMHYLDDNWPEYE